MRGAHAPICSSFANMSHVSRSSTYMLCALTKNLGNIFRFALNFFLAGSENIREPSDSNDESSDDDQSAPSLEVSFEERSLQSTCSENDAAENVETHYTKTPNVFNAVPISA